MKYCLILVLLFGTIHLSAQQPDLSIDSVMKAGYTTTRQYKDSGISIKGIYIGTRKIYDEHDKLLFAINYGDYKLPRTISARSYFRKGPATTSEGNYIQTSDKYIAKNGVWKWQRKNGSLTDSIIYRDDRVLLRAMFSKSGKLEQIERYPEFPRKGAQIKITGYNRDGSVKFNRIEIVGKNGY